MIIHVILWHRTQGSDSFFLFFGKKYFVEHSHLDLADCTSPVKTELSFFLPETNLQLKGFQTLSGIQKCVAPILLPV